jgi:hypothetical protein
MTRRIFVFFGLALLIALPSAAAAKSPKLKSLAVYRTHAGAMVVIANADYTGNAKTAKGLPDTRSRGILTVTLINGNHRISATDTTLFGEASNRGRLVHFDIRIPASQAKVLGSPSKIRVRSTLGREATTANGRRLPGTRQTMPGLPDMIIVVGHGSCIDAMSGEFVRCPPPPPAPPVGFEGWQGGNEALICVDFWGSQHSAYGNPQWYNIQLSAADGTTVGYVFPAGVSTEVASDGTFSWGSYLDVFVGGYAQISSGPTLSGSIPTSVLSAPVNSSTGNATLNALPQMQGLPTTWTLTPLSQSEAAGVC